MLEHLLIRSDEILIIKNNYHVMKNNLIEIKYRNLCLFMICFGLKVYVRYTSI
jgi:hypothetical protein